MCGIVGYIGKKNVCEVLLNGLSHLEYRGYDSAGIALGIKGEVKILKAGGKLSNLKDLAKAEAAVCSKATYGIGHTRWATHGLPTIENAHPHTCNCGSLTLVHNGIIENHLELRAELEKMGCRFVSQTDTETIAHLIAHEYSKHKNLLLALRTAVKKIKGAYALCIMHKDIPDEIVITRKNAPLLVGLGEGENYIASDTPAIIEYTKKVIYLNDGEVARVTKTNVEIYDKDGGLLANQVEMLPFEPAALSKMGYKHFMLKEIHEQPDVVRNVLSGRLVGINSKIILDEVKLTPERLKNINRIQIIACGTSLHAGMVAKYIIEQLAHMPVDVEASSEYIYRETIADANTLVIGISQSGETADSITAIKQVKEKGSHVLIITNRPESTMARMADSLIPVSAGIEVSVAATKSYIAQLISLYLFAIYLAEVSNTTPQSCLKEIKEELLQLPSKIESILSNTKPIYEVAKKYSNYKNFIYIARGVNYPSALEGALKLKEISYINATGYSSGELKHGPIAMLDESMPVLAILNEGTVYEKVLSNCQEAKARQAKLIGVMAETDESNKGLFDDILLIPSISDFLSPTLNVVTLQLMAYFIAEYLGKDVDQPRNLAKSVTVE